MQGDPIFPDYDVIRDNDDEKSNDDAVEMIPNDSDFKLADKNHSSDDQRLTLFSCNEIRKDLTSTEIGIDSAFLNLDKMAMETHSVHQCREESTTQRHVCKHVFLHRSDSQEMFSSGLVTSGERQWQNVDGELIWRTSCGDLSDTAGKTRRGKHDSDDNVWLSRNEDCQKRRQQAVIFSNQWRDI